MDISGTRAHRDGTQIGDGDGVMWGGRHSAEIKCLADVAAGAHLLGRQTGKHGPAFKIATLGKVR